MIRLPRCFHYLLRKPRTYGFGVQSPFAYRFIRQVVHGGHGFQYAQSFGQLLSGVTRRNRRLLLLVAKLAVYSQADVCFVSPELMDSRFGKLLREMQLNTVNDLLLLDEIKFAVISSEYADYGLLLDRMAVNGLLVVNGVRKDNRTYRFWNQLIADPRTFVSFDLYDMGVIFFDPKIYKRNYRCNY